MSFSSNKACCQPWITLERSFWKPKARSPMAPGKFARLT
uniref:Uncharacterized protein n=1 Tax=Anguilla anguilla TaxID=7936 RepID=A0A0E9VJX1_ANGAN